jgi:hypothetical protein
MELLDGMRSTMITCNNGVCWKGHGTNARTEANCAEPENKGFVTSLVTTDVKTLSRVKLLIGLLGGRYLGEYS